MSVEDYREILDMLDMGEHSLCLSVIKSDRKKGNDNVSFLVAQSDIKGLLLENTFSGNNACFQSVGALSENTKAQCIVDLTKASSTIFCPKDPLIIQTIHLYEKVRKSTLKHNNMLVVIDLGWVYDMKKKRDIFREMGYENMETAIDALETEGKRIRFVEFYVTQNWSHPLAETFIYVNGEVAAIDTYRKTIQRDALRSVEILKCLREKQNYHERIDKDVDEILVDCCLEMNRPEKKKQLIQLVNIGGFENKCDRLREYLVAIEVSLRGRIECSRKLQESFNRVSGELALELERENQRALSGEVEQHL
jgi:hypothetical protein